MRYRWIFVAGTIFVTCLFLIHLNLLTFLIVLYWYIRLLYLNDKKVFIISTGFTLILFIQIFTFPRHSDIPEDTTEAITYIKPTSLKIDGDSLRFESYIFAYDESIIVQYKIDSELEKEQLLNQLPNSVILKGQLVSPEPNNNINQFNYNEYLKRQKIFYVFKAEEIKNVRNSHSPPLSFLLDQWRFKVIKTLERYFDGLLLNYIQALIFADYNSLDLQTTDLYKSLGIVHLISISGLHIDLIIQLISKLMNYLHISKERSNVFLMLLLPFYLIITGMGVSVFRAVISNVLSLFFNHCGYRLSKSDCWSITLILALILNPMIIFSIGFQLSYGLSGLLILLSESKILDTFSSINQVLIINVLMNLVSIPIITYHFFEFPMIAFILNILYIPIFSTIVFPLIVLSLFIGVTFQQSLITDNILSMVNGLLQFSEKILFIISDLKWMTIIPGRLSLLGYFGVIVALLLMIIKLNQFKSKWFFIGCIIYLIALNSNRLSILGHIYMVDVGQGESILIKPPLSSEGMLIDTGGMHKWEKEDWQQRINDYSIAENELIPTIKSFGINTLNRVYLTHGDNDHIGELEKLVTNFNVKEVASSKATLSSELFQTFKLDNQTDIIEIKAPSTLNKTGVDMIALYPVIELDDSNNASLVLAGQFGNLTWLFTGDLEEAGELELIKYYPDLKIDVLKVGHHGSETSSSSKFIDHFSPNYALISAGYNNRYNHPHEVVINRLNNSNTIVYRTDLEGGILYTYSNNSIINQLFTKFITVK